MTESTAGALAQVSALDEERRRYEAWITQLEARRGAAPDHVLERVRGDYEGRLRDVVLRLREHAELLRGAVAEWGQEVVSLREAEGRRQDERAEAELRAAVGEYTPERWQELASRGDAELADLAARRAEAEQELERLEQVLVLAGGSDSDAPAAPVAPAEPPLDDRDAEADAERYDERLPAAPVAAAPFGDEASPSAYEPPVTRPAMDTPWDDEPALPTGRADGPVAAAPFVPPPSVAPSASVDGEGTQAKTLRCQECGTMNYPTEWYCERCGGELAAM